jgi:hypothetical protein
MKMGEGVERQTDRGQARVIRNEHLFPLIWLQICARGTHFSFINVMFLIICIS